jgi:hypothetical protein
MMVTALREAGRRFVIALDDHEPAPAHGFSGGEAKINLAGTKGVAERVQASGMKRDWSGDADRE